MHFKMILFIILASTVLGLCGEMGCNSDPDPTLLLTIVPPNAQVAVNNYIHIGDSPHKIEFKSAGQYTLKVSHDDYLSVAMFITLKNGEFHNQTIELIPDENPKEQAQISAKPEASPKSSPETLIIADSLPLNQPPITTSGDDNNIVNNNNNSNYSFGYISVDTTPWTTVYINGQPIGQTPILKHKLKLGTHKIIMENRNLGKRRTQIINIVKNTHLRLVELL